MKNTQMVSLITSGEDALDAERFAVSEQKNMAAQSRSAIGNKSRSYRILSLES